MYLFSQTELLGGTPRNVLKEDAVPTIFCFTKTTKKRASSEVRAANSSKRQFIEEVYSESICEDIAEETTLVQQKSFTTMIDKGIDNSVRTATKSTQYQRQLSEQPAKKDDTLKVKIKKRKTHDAATNTDISFAPDLLVSFHVNNPERNQREDETDETADEELDDMIKDPDFEPEDENPSEDEIKEGIADEKQQYFVFWSCLKMLFFKAQCCVWRCYVEKDTQLDGIRSQL